MDAAWAAGWTAGWTVGCPGWVELAVLIGLTTVGRAMGVIGVLGVLGVVAVELGCWAGGCWAGVFSDYYSSSSSGLIGDTVVVPFVVVVTLTGTAIGRTGLTRAGKGTGTDVVVVVVVLVVVLLRGVGCEVACKWGWSLNLMACEVKARAARVTVARNFMNKYLLILNLKMCLNWGRFIKPIMQLF